MRVAVTQFTLTSNIEENQVNCIRLVEQAMGCKPFIIVLPALEITNVSDSFIKVLGKESLQNLCYITFNIFGDTPSSALITPKGEVLYQEENSEPKLFPTQNGKFGLLNSKAVSTFLPSRKFMQEGVQLLCHSMNSFSLDKTNMYCPTRASENKIFLAVANSIDKIHANNDKSELFEPESIPEQYLVGSGQSQIISPSGKVLAKIENNKEGFVYADIDLALADNKLRPDGTELLNQRRPDLYQTLFEISENTKALIEHNANNHQIPKTVNVALFATYKSNEEAIEDVCFYIENNLSDVIQLPELFFISDKSITHNEAELVKIEALSQQLIQQISTELRSFQYVCTSLVIEGKHQAVIINEQGLFATQQQLHFCERYQWTELGNTLNIIDLPLEQGAIKVAMLTADDANIPEIVDIAALNNIHALLIPFDIQEANEVEHCLLSRAAEHGLCIVASSCEKSFTQEVIPKLSEEKQTNKKKVKPQKSTGFVANLTTRKALLTQFKSRKFTGYIDKPTVKYQHGKITKALIHLK